MDACFDSREDDLFAEIERRLMILISEGEGEEEESLSFGPLKNSVKKDFYPCYGHRSHATKEKFALRSTLKKPINGTGVFIPHLPSATWVRPERDQPKKVGTRVGNLKPNGRR